MLDILLWAVRRSDRDLINVYNSFTPILKLANGGYTLNRGYWNENTSNPLEAEQQLCKLIGQFACFESARTMLDVGSGISSPAINLKSIYDFVDIVCLDLNFNQLKNAIKKYNDTVRSETFSLELNSKSLTHINATATVLPLADHSVDRIVAVESHYHFSPLNDFIQESKRVLGNNGLLIIASPIKTFDSGIISDFLKLGFLTLPFNSRNFVLTYIKSVIANCGFHIKDILSIGSHVFPPITEYYIRNRKTIKQCMPREYPSFTEKALFKLVTKTNEAYWKGKIDYVLIKCCPQ